MIPIYHFNSKKSANYSSYYIQGINQTKNDNKKLDILAKTVYVGINILLFDLSLQVVK